MAQIVGYHIGWGDSIEIQAAHFSSGGNGTYVPNSYLINGQQAPAYVTRWLDKEYWRSNVSMEQIEYSSDFGDYYKYRVLRPFTIPAA